jgi:hypothetical protein
LLSIATAARDEMESGGRIVLSYQSWHTSVNGRIRLQARYFVLYQQLATFQFNDLEIVDRRVITGFSEFRFQGPMPSFQFRKMRFYGHVGGFS